MPAKGTQSVLLRVQGSAASCVAPLLFPPTYNIRTYSHERASSSKYCTEDGDTRDGTSSSNGIRIAGHSEIPHLRYGAKRMVSLSVQTFMLVSVPPLQFFQKWRILSRKSALMCHLLGCFFSECFGPADCSRISFHVPFGTIFCMRVCLGSLEYRSKRETRFWRK